MPIMSEVSLILSLAVLCNVQKNGCMFSSCLQTLNVCAGSKVVLPWACHAPYAALYNWLCAPTHWTKFVTNHAVCMKGSRLPYILLTTPEVGIYLNKVRIA